MPASSLNHCRTLGGTHSNDQVPTKFVRNWCDCVLLWRVLNIGASDHSKLISLILILKSVKRFCVWSMMFFGPEDSTYFLFYICYVYSDNIHIQPRASPLARRRQHSGGPRCPLACKGHKACCAASCCFFSVWGEGGGPSGVPLFRREGTREAGLICLSWI